MSVSDRYAEVKRRVEEAAARSGRFADEVTLIAVTKTHPASEINEAIDAGATDIGENRVQEVLEKYDDVKPVRWHLIGHLQTNKVRQIVGEVSMIQSVDSIRLANEIAKRSLAAGITTDILAEINVGGEDSKSGIEWDSAEETIAQLAEIKGIRLQGLMAIPPVCENSDEARMFFSKMRRLFVDIRDKKLDNVNMNVLSMGMSGDYKQAILEGANLVRVGSAIFGARIYR
jgi:pyridoxal phosphate enzyme (YggS family)